MNGNGAGPRRVVVTGMGAVTPLGLDVASSWESAREGRSGAGPITLFDASELPVRIAAEVKGFDPVAIFGPKDARRTSRVVLMAMAAARQAAADSGLDIAAEADDVGVLIGCGVGGLEVTERASVTVKERGWRRVWPFTVPAMIPDMSAGQVSIDLGARGHNLCVVTACATGVNALGEAAEVIRRGDAEAMVAGGAESGITPVGIASFAVTQALTARNHEPERASRPFDRDRDGFLTGEGATVMILEELEHARRRGARTYAEIVGYGSTADASHITQPLPDGSGAVKAMQRALRRARRGIEDVDYISAHGTSTLLNDASETRAVRTLFGERAQGVPMSSVKSMTGHLLGAAGAFETLICIQAMRDRWLPPTINLDNPDPECDLDYVPNTGRAASPRLCLNNAFGFGGHNATLAVALVED